MSHQVGAYLGGIRTIEDVRKRCRIDDETGCWLWSLYVVNGRPQCCYTLPDGTRRKQSARRCVAELKAGRVLPPTVFAFAAAHCNEPTCANPAHTRTGNRTQANRATAKSARFLAGAARRSMKATICNRLVRAKITMEIAREIRGRTEPAHVLEREYPIKRSAISNIRAGKSWRETVSGASVFAWRAAPSRMDDRALRLREGQAHRRGGDGGRKAQDRDPQCHASPVPKRTDCDGAQGA